MQLFENCIILYDTCEDLVGFFDKKGKRKLKEINTTETTRSREDRNYVALDIRATKYM